MIVDTDHYYYRCMLHRFYDTAHLLFRRHSPSILSGLTTRNTVMTCIIILVTWILDISLHGLSHSMLAWSLYTFMSYLHITDTHAYNVSHLLSYDSLCTLHRLLFHVIVSMLYDRFLLMIRIFLLLDMWAVDMRYVGSPHLLFPFPVYCSCYLVHVILFLIPVILFYAINRAQVQLSCYPYHVQ